MYKFHVMLVRFDFNLMILLHNTHLPNVFMLFVAPIIS